MRRVLVLYAHPGQSHAKANSLMATTASALKDVTVVDLYAEYPRLKINVDKEQERLINHDVIVFQFPVYWYSTPSLLKEWQDLVLEYGFAYGPGGHQLAGKLCLLAMTAGGPAEAYRADGTNHFTLRTLFSPFEQTARLCQMDYLAPLALLSSLSARDDGRIEQHAFAYGELLTALRDDRLDIGAARALDLMSATNLPIQPARPEPMP
ncbi:MAG: NAD(P)H-dependent oxidoreductase [Burkholderiaceae bacterium]